MDKKEVESVVISTLPELNRFIRKKILHEQGEGDFPLSIELHRSFEYPVYKITIEKKNNDVFVDSIGNKWRKEIE